MKDIEYQILRLRMGWGCERRTIEEVIYEMRQTYHVELTKQEIRRIEYDYKHKEK